MGKKSYDCDFGLMNTILVIRLRFHSYDSDFGLMNLVGFFFEKKTKKY